MGLFSQQSTSDFKVHRHKKAKIPKPVLDNSHIHLSLQKLGNPPESWHLDKNRRGKNAHASEMLNLSRKRGSTVGKHHLIKRKSYKLSHTRKAWKLTEDGTKINEEEK